MTRRRQLVFTVVGTLAALFVAVDLAILVLPPELVLLDGVIGGFWETLRESPALVMTFVLWQLVLLYTIPVSFWSYLFVFYLWKHYRPTRRGDDEVSIEWTPDAVQVRVLTIDNENVVQETVDSLPDTLSDVVVVAEADIDVDGADVVVVPESFTCEFAQFKGRAIEYARIHHPTDKEYVLYLDEDTRIPSFDGIPSNADIVQFRERPVRTGGILPYLAEIHRIGFNIEQRAFPYLRVPFYAWGGGIAIRRSLEDRITWDTDTIVEDSVFAWRAVLDEDATFEVVDTFFENQAPPSVRAMIGQRRRWLTGTRSKSRLLPWDYRILYHFRDIGWAVSVFGPVFWVTSALTYAGIETIPLTVLVLPEVYVALSLVLLAHVYLWSLLGLIYYRERPHIWLGLLVLTPFVVLLHSAGALYGILSPARQFAVTEKVSNTVENAAETVVELTPLGTDGDATDRRDD